MPNHRISNFAAGPSSLPESVLEEAALGLLNFQNTGIGIAEISHRSKEFITYIRSTESLIREQLEVPDTHHILFIQGGGTAQFSTVVLNLLARHRLLHPSLPEEQRTLDYVVTGNWSKLASQEAQRLAGRSTINIAVDARQHSKDGKSFDNIPPHHAYKFSSDPALIYYCENETVDGVQFSHESGEGTEFPFHLLPGAQDKSIEERLLPLVADYSSSFMSRPIPHLAAHAIIYAGAQKNIGPAGVAVLIVRKDCIVDVDAASKLGACPVPAGLNYGRFVGTDSMPNTPPVLAIYIVGLVMRRNRELGGVKYYERINRRKKEMVYEVVREGVERGVFREKVVRGSQSWMNVVFDVIGEEVEKRFVDGAKEREMVGIKGHR
jgi:phosphoserine aminotransferase